MYEKSCVGDYSLDSIFCDAYVPQSILQSLVEEHKHLGLADISSFAKPSNP